MNGKAVTNDFLRRLSECEIVDRDGVSSDSVRLKLDDNPPAEIPQPGARIAVSLGYGENLVPMGSYLAEEVEVECLPYAITIHGKAAEMGGPVKEMRRRHWDQVSLKDVIADIAGEIGVQPVVDAALGAFHYEWLGQIAESNAAFLERLAERHGALFSIKDGRLVFAKRGAGQSATGKPLTGLVVTPATLITGSCRVTFSTRSVYRTVKATWMDRTTGRKRSVTVQGDKDSDAEFEIGQPFATRDEAKAAAEAKAGSLGRKKLQFTASLIGDPTIRAGAPVQFSGVRPGVDGLPLIIEEATHRFSKANGYTTDISGSIKD
ncbi:phage late control D family protein [Paracoccus aerius]|uniref:phage late control D family protein n=1 Tax=Paracoccus aerius TaxID=1915382 RepID=UPI0036094A55